jgi:hypothetical protein
MKPSDLYFAALLAARAALPTATRELILRRESEIEKWARAGAPEARSLAMRVAMDAAARDECVRAYDRLAQIACDALAAEKPEAQA